MHAPRVSASLLSANFLHLEKEIQAAEAAGVKTFHLDVMDNHMVPNLSYGTPIIEWVRKATTLPLETHLMIDRPEFYAADFAKIPVDLLFIHAECYSSTAPDHSKIKSEARSTNEIDPEKAMAAIHLIKSMGVKVGLTCNPKTPISVFADLIPECDALMLMGISPGFSGQKFMPEVLEKIKQCRALFSGDIHVDGGVNQETAPAILEAGANVLISASYLFSSPDYKAAVESLLP